MGGSERTSLYAKLFINGFSRPSYLVVVAELSGAVDVAIVREVLADCLEREVRLRSLVEFSRLGVPVRFRHQPVARWFDAGCFQVVEGFDFATLASFRRELLVAPMALDREFPLRVWVLRGDGRSALVVKVHHAVVDARTSRPILLRFVTRYRARAAGRDLAPVPPPAPPLRREGAPALLHAWRWLRSARLDARVPDVSLIAEPGLGAAATGAGVCCAERVLPARELARITDEAAQQGLTFPQHVCAATLRALGVYNAKRAVGAASAPERVGLMVAASQRPQVNGGAADEPSVDTILLSVERSLLARERAPELAAAVRSALRRHDARHNGLLLWAFYASRRLRALGGAAPSPDTRAVHLLYSDGSSLATRFRGALELSPSLRVERLHYVATPVARDQAMLVTYAYGDEFRVALMYDEGVLRGEEFLADLDAELGVPTPEPSR